MDLEVKGIKSAFNNSLLKRFKEVDPGKPELEKESISNTMAFHFLILT